MKTVNTQLASWTQLRHDTILYGQTVLHRRNAVRVSCWFRWSRFRTSGTRFEKMATRAADLDRKDAVPPNRIVEKDVRFGEKVLGQGKRSTCSMVAEASSGVSSATSPATSAQLKSIAAKELEQKPLDDAERQKSCKTWCKFIAGSGGTRYNGWYPQIFYKEPKDSGKWDALVRGCPHGCPVRRVGAILVVC